MSKIHKGKHFERTNVLKVKLDRTGANFTATCHSVAARSPALAQSQNQALKIAPDMHDLRAQRSATLRQASPRKADVMRRSSLS